jgi:cell division septation protein DedD
MDTGLKQRLIGAAVLVALAVIFLPMLVKGPAPDSGVSDVSLKMPAGPEGDVETRELPLVMPGDVPKGGAVGMDATPVDGANAATTTVPATPGDLAAAGTPSADPAATPDGAAPPPSDPATALPPTTAAGDYAVHFGAYASQKGADTVVGLAKTAGLPAYSEATTVGGKPAFRVRIGPYATRAEAEIVRVKALEVRSDVPVRVVALDAEPAPAAPAPSPAPAATETAKPATAAKPAEAKPESKPQPPKPAEPRPAEPKPVAVAKPAETKPATTAARPAAPAPAPRPATPAPKPVAAAPAAGKVGFAVQVGAFGDATEAGAMREKLRAAGFTAFTETVDTDKGKLVRVRVGPVVDRAAADQLKAQIQAKTGIDGIVRSHP